MIRPNRTKEKSPNGKHIERFGSVNLKALFAAAMAKVEADMVKRLGRAVGKGLDAGVYDVQHNLGTVYVGRSADTATFAVDNIAQWCATGAA